MTTLAVLIAKSGVELLNCNIISPEWEVAIADFSRMDQREVTWWNYPQKKKYSKILIFDRNLTTALTQLHIEKSLKGLGIKGPVKYVGNEKTLLAYRHQSYLLRKEGMVKKTEALAQDAYQIGKYMIALVGLPASGKTFLRNIFSRMDGFSAYKWGDYVKQEIESRYREMNWANVQRFTEEVETKDKIVVARRFVSSVKDDSPFMVVDGIKSREQIIYASYALQRPVIVISVRRDEKERQREAEKRGDFDDSVDSERLEFLRKIGALDVVNFADFIINTTGCSVEYEGDICRIRIPQGFVSGMHEVLSWIFASESIEATKKLVQKAAVEVAEQRGAATVEVNRMDWLEKVAAINSFYMKSFENPRPWADVPTSGSYAKKVRKLAVFGKRTEKDVEEVCQLVEHLRKAFKIMDDLIDEDEVRDYAPAFWVVNGAWKTIEQAAYHLGRARKIATELGIATFEERVREVILAARLEVKMENPKFTTDLTQAELWGKVVMKEASFRLLIAEALNCSESVCGATYQDGVAAQMLDDGLSALHGKDGRKDNSDERLGRLTYMRAFGISPKKTIQLGRKMKKKIAPILGQEEK
jgi:cytidylate kinase